MLPAHLHSRRLKILCKKISRVMTAAAETGLKKPLGNEIELRSMKLLQLYLLGFKLFSALSGEK